MLAWFFMDFMLIAGDEAKKGFAGTITHTAPEHLKDLNSIPTTKSDVFSFGILIWELLSGKIPYVYAADPQIIIANVIIGQRPDIELVETGAPEILLKIMQQSWNKDPIQRPEFAVILKELSTSNYWNEQGSKVENLVRRLLLQDQSSEAILKTSQSDLIDRKLPYSSVSVRNKTEDNLRSVCPSFGGTDGETNAKIVYHDPEHDTHVTEPPSLSTRETASTGDSGRESYTSTLPYYGSTIQGDSVTYDDEPLLDNCREEGSPNVSDQPTIDVIPRKRWKWTCRIFVAFCVIAGIAAIAFLLLHIFVNNHCQRLKVSNPQENITCSPHTSSSSDYLPHGAVCRITCQSGFGIKNGSSTLTCKGTGAWSAPTPTCSKLGVCPSLPQPAGGGSISCTNGNYEMSVCKFTCPTGFRIRIPSTLEAVQSKKFEIRDTASATCFAVGGDISQMAWSIPEPYCEKVQLCDPPRPTEHGLYKCSEPSLRKADSNAQLGNGTVCTLTCSDGYDVKGVADVKCMESGKWNNTNIHCWKVCPQLTAPLNGHYTCTQGRFTTSVCDFTCDGNFTRVGASYRSCLSNGVWNNDQPRCQCVACRSGTHCQYSLHWKDAVDAMNRSLAPPKDFDYAGRTIRCTPNPQKPSFDAGKSSNSSNSCICRDKLNRGKQCNEKDATMSVICQKSLAQLIFIMAYDEQYLLPCDGDNMPQSC